MTNPLQRLRWALEAYRKDEATERDRRFRGVEGADSEEAVAERHWKFGDVDEVREMLSLAAGGGGLADINEAALRAHAARTAADFALAPGRDALEAASVARVKIGRNQVGIDDAFDAFASEHRDNRADAQSALVQGAESIGEVLGAARYRADEAGFAVFRGGEAPPDAGPPRGDLAEEAGDFLAATDDIAEEARRYLAPEERSLHVLLGGLRAPAAGAPVPRGGRFRRLADDIRALGFEGDLRARVRTGGTHPFPGPKGRVVVVSVPDDVRLFEAGRERGVTSELAAADALGRALGHVLVSPALPVEERRPLAGSVPRALGVLWSQLVADRVLLTRGRGLGSNQADVVGRSAAAILILLARVRAAALIARVTEKSPDTRAEAGSTLLQRALGVPVPIAHARLAVVLPAAHGPRFRGTVVGLGLAVALRERFDEDWFRNPRAAEPIRAAAVRGNMQDAETFLADLGGSSDMAGPRLGELFG
ncbi:MAG: hypothetical protein JRH11_12930 [Deltaproteobacteria bacterium]|nr:hypothetical protein [Deltaproteobacteria bacterium]